MDTTSPSSGTRLPIRFVGSGSEYFRIWIVNLLLTVVTLGLYYPFAKVRRLRYFHGATEVGGHALAFHGDPWKMFRGYLLTGALFIAYGVAGKVSPMAGLVAFGFIVVLWPALWHGSLRFRLANTGWRGLRLRFTGGLGGAYLAMLPAGLLALAFFGLGFAVEAMADPEEQGGSPWLALLPLLAAVVMPGLLWAIKRYQHGHYALGDEGTRFGVSVGGFYSLSLRSSFVSGIVFLVVGGAAALVFYAGRARWLADADAEQGLGWAPLLAMMVVFVVVQVAATTYFTARLQDLVWNGTRSRHLTFESRLRYRELAWLTLRNWLLMLVTLGFYYPFAKVATARLRLQAVALRSAIDPDLLVAAPGAGADGVAGDAAADLLGIDIGL